MQNDEQAALLAATPTAPQAPAVAHEPDAHTVEVSVAAAERVYFLQSYPLSLTSLIQHIYCVITLYIQVHAPKGMRLEFKITGQGNSVDP